MEVYQYKSYKDFLKSIIKANKLVYGYKAQLAKKAGCHRPYLSQVLLNKAHLMEEHALNLCLFWNFDDRATKYFLTLLSKDRASTSSLKEYYQRELNRLKSESETLANRFNQQRIENEYEGIYYSDWIFSAVHIILTIPEYRTPQAIAHRLGLSSHLIIEILSRLEKMGLARNSGNQWSITNSKVHLPKESIYTFQNHKNWREQAVKNNLMKNQQKCINYTAVYSLSKKDFEDFRYMLLNFIDRTRTLVEPSIEETLIAFCCDLFEI